MNPVLAIQVQLYRMANGRIPFREWLLKLQKKTRARIRARLANLRLGNLGDNRALGSGLWELRDFSGPGYRIYFTRQGSRVILLLAGGDKGSQQNDIRRARRYLDDWRQRMQHED